MKKFITDILIPVLVFLTIMFGVYKLVMINISRIKSDPTNTSYITMQERERELNCLADSIFFEANNQNAEGKVGVAQVIINRKNSGKYPNDICKVVYQSSQFSFVADKPKALRVKNVLQYNEAKDVAKKVLLEGFRLPALKTALYYYSDSISEPYWAKGKVKLIKIGNHTFYS